MRKIILDTWPLFFGLTMIMMGNGLQGTLLGVRAGIEGFSVSVTGLVMSCYYFGFLAGSILTPHLVEKVGHIRVFAGLASIASVTVLGHIVSDNPALWGAFRILTGFGYAGLFVVIESWLNDACERKTRGRLLAFYMMVSYAGLILGQYLISVASPAEADLFVMTSALVSLSLVPLSLISRRAPDFSAPEIISLRHLHKLSPQGLYGVFISGFFGGIVLGIGAVYAYTAGFNTFQIASFVAFFVLGGVILQYPLGLLSDHIGRRYVLSGVGVISTVCALAAYFFEGTLIDNFLLMKITAFALGGFGFPIYSLSLAHVNDRLSVRMMTRASGKMILVNGAGAIAGPLIATMLMGQLGTSGFFLALALAHGLFTFMTVYRSAVAESVPVEDQSEFTPMPARVSPVMAELASEEE